MRKEGSRPDFVGRFWKEHWAAQKSYLSTLFVSVYVLLQCMQSTVMIHVHQISIVVENSFDLWPSMYMKWWSCFTIHTNSLVQSSTEMTMRAQRKRNYGRSSMDATEREAHYPRDMFNNKGIFERWFKYVRYPCSWEKYHITSAKKEYSCRQ